MIAANDIRACIPARFNVRDTESMAAEAAFGVLENAEARKQYDGVGGQWRGLGYTPLT